MLRENLAGISIRFYISYVTVRQLVEDVVIKYITPRVLYLTFNYKSIYVFSKKQQC